MKSGLRELQSNTFSAQTSANSLAGISTMRMASVPQMLTMLREEDPAFDKVVVTQRVERGQQVASPEAMASRMYVLMSGKVNLLCTNNEGRRLVIATLEPGAIFGEGALNDIRDPNVFAEAAEDALVWVIPSSEARNMTMQYPILGWGLLQTYGMRLMQVENSLEDVAYKKLPERLAALLIDLDQDGSGVIKGVSHQALADRLGTYRETVSAILRDFKRQGLVELGYRRIKLADVEALRDVAGLWDW
ncbi:MAG TPA: Crp/Fnr family transcriptional regulator [Chloroflexi bacterium]|nr:Crp/Fnr family transcriptional regulator [Chloroflexota bacterium]